MVIQQPNLDCKFIKVLLTRTEPTLTSHAPGVGDSGVKMWDLEILPYFDFIVAWGISVSQTCLVDMVTLTFVYFPKTLTFMRRHFTINLLANTMWNLNFYIELSDITLEISELFSETYVGCTASYFVKIIRCSRWFCPPPSFEAVYCYICGRRRVAVARYRMICLVHVLWYKVKLPWNFKWYHFWIKLLISQYN